MISCILHDADIILVAKRSITRTFQSFRSFCRTDSHRNISLMSSKYRKTNLSKRKEKNLFARTCSDEFL
jgi:hypothetical protein